MAKKEKVFVETKDTALQLAESIAASQEEKASIKKKRSRERKEDLDRSRKNRTAGVSRLKKAKEIVMAQKAQAKKEKAKSHPVTSSSNDLPPRAKKGVSFA